MVRAWNVGRDGGNEVPVEGIEEEQMITGLYCDDGIVTDVEQLRRLCVIVRILTLLMTMQLVMIGYMWSVFDVLQWRLDHQATLRGSLRERVICGAACDGGVHAARNANANIHSNNGLAESLGDNEPEGEGGEDLILERMEENESNEQKIHDDETLEPLKLEQPRGSDL